MEIVTLKIVAEQPAKTLLIGQETIALTSGQNLAITTKTPAHTVLDVDVPVGKKWEIAISLNITEVDE